MSALFSVASCYLSWCDIKEIFCCRVSFFPTWVFKMRACRLGGLRVLRLGGLEAACCCFLYWKLVGSLL